MSFLRIQLPVIQPTPPCGRGLGGGLASTSPPEARRGGTTSPPRPEPSLILDGEGGLELSAGQPNSGAIIGNTSSPDHSSLAAGHALFSFAPSPIAQSQLLEALSDPTFSLLSLARTYNTDLDALIVWMERPDIQEKLTAIENASIRRNRLVANTRMTKVIQSCEDILNGYSDEELNNPIRRTDTSAIEQRRRSRETARKAAWLIFRISRTSAPPRVARLSEPGRCDPAATSNAPVPRPARSLESLRAELAALPTRQHIPQAPVDNRVEDPSTQFQDSPRQAASTPNPTTPPSAPQARPDESHASSSLVEGTADSGRRSAGAEPRPQIRRGGTEDFLALTGLEEQRPPSRDREHHPSHASHASHTSHLQPPDSS